MIFLFLRSIAIRLPARLGVCLAASLPVLLGASGCTTFDVNVAAKEPLKVDLNMEIHVIQKDPNARENAEVEIVRSAEDAREQRTNRMEEIAGLKNSRIVGESREWLLEIRTLPGGSWGKRVREVVKAENLDREILIEHEAEQKGIPVDEVRKARWKAAIEESFPGELIEVEGDKPGSFRWEKKTEASDEEDGSEASADPE